MMDLTLDQLRALAAAVSEGTFEAAADKLHVTPSAISQRVKSLESSVGRALLVRAKPVRTTASGERLLRVARQIETITSEVAAELGDPHTGTGLGKEPRGAARPPVVISIAANADSLDTWLVPAMAEVGGGVVFDIVRDDEGRTAEFLRRGDVMAAVTALSVPVPGCVVERLGELTYRPKATREFVDTWFPQGVSPAALELAPVVVFDREDHLQERYLRRRTRRRLDPPRHYVPGSHAFLQAVRAGLGWGMLPDLQDPPALSTLVEMDPRGAFGVTLYWQQWRLGSETLERVAEAVRSAATRMLS